MRQLQRELDGMSLEMVAEKLAVGHERAGKAEIFTKENAGNEGWNGKRET
jgi:hypothetical protein